jgi:hypothetical protein
MMLCLLPHCPEACPGGDGWEYSHTQSFGRPVGTMRQSNLRVFVIDIPRAQIHDYCVDQQNAYKHSHRQRKTSLGFISFSVCGVQDHVSLQSSSVGSGCLYWTKLCFALPRNRCVQPIQFLQDETERLAI